MDVFEEDATDVGTAELADRQYLPSRGMMFPMAVKWRVDELVERRGWSARELAERAGLDVKTVRAIMTGRATRVDLETIGRLADALGVSPGDLWRQSTRLGLAVDGTPQTG